MASINFNPFEGWFRKPPNPLPGPKKPDPKPEFEPKKPGHYTQLLEQFFWECENLPDYRHTPEVDKILNDDPIWEKKENPTEEKLKENEKFWKEFRASPVVQFLARAEQISDKINDMELKENEKPRRSEDKKLILGAAATIHKLQKEEAVESKRRDLAVLEANDGVWPGVRTPSHALFLWASGSELATILKQDHMPNKYIPKDLRLELSRI
ncbi:hypothetical protein M0R45_028907 [Rubus argutus]|uniref:Uncharacterized protein n=1 Tax=Rubus argutus TaxID=59490 RepID=A0AAW1W7G0_RUBAR